MFWRAAPRHSCANGHVAAYAGAIVQASRENARHSRALSILFVYYLPKGSRREEANFTVVGNTQRYCGRSFPIPAGHRSCKVILLLIQDTLYLGTVSLGEIEHLRYNFVQNVSALQTIESW